jgi:hypothetical protein
MIGTTTKADGRDATVVEGVTGNGQKIDDAAVGN